MRDSFLHPLRPTVGEKRLLTALVGTATCGGFVAFVIVTQMGQSKAIMRQLTGADLWFVFAGILGALGGLYLGRHWIGYDGLRGAFKAAAGTLVVSFVGALIGGTLALPLYGTMFGPLMFALTLWSNPVLALLWINTLVMSHLLIRVFRRERAAMPVSPLPVHHGHVPRLARRFNWLTPTLDRAKR